MTPERAQPFHVALHLGVTGQEPQRLGDVAASHLFHAPEQGARVIERDPRAAAGIDQPGDELRHAPVAVGEWLGIVVIALVGMLQHELEMGNQSSVCPGRDAGLMHVQRTAEARAEGVELSVG